MGITMAHLQRLRDLRVVPDAGRILDIGSSNLYSADPGSIEAFARSFGRTLDPKFVAELAAGSAYGSGVTKNASFVGQLIEAVGLGYLAFDIANGYRTEIFDLNFQQLSADLRGSFDTIINFGTTEHVVNQLNSFEVIHDATKAGGHIVHSLPSIGFIDHGFFCYTPRFFFDLCGYNEYEVVDFQYDGPADGPELYGIVRDYTTYFPALKQAPLNTQVRLPNYSITIVIRKKHDRSFKLPVETSTSVVTDNSKVLVNTQRPELQLEEMSFGALTQYWLKRMVSGGSRR